MYPLPNETLSLSAIAKEWSRCDSRFSESYILTRLFRAFWRGELEQAEGDRTATLWLIQQYGMPNPKAPEEFGRPCAYEVVPESLEELPWFKSPTQALKEWPIDIVERAFDELAEAEADSYSQVLRNIVGAYELERKAFGDWCDTQKIRRPEFWFDVLVQARRGMGGRPPKWDWAAFSAEMARSIHDEGLPSTRAELARKMLQWFIDEYGGHPAESEVKKRVSATFMAFRKKAEN